MTKVLVRAGLVVLTLLVLVLGYGLGVGPRLILDRRRIQAQLPEPLQELAGTEVTFLSDL